MNRIIIGLVIFGTLCGSQVYRGIFFNSWYIDDVSQVADMPSLYPAFAKTVYGDVTEVLDCGGGIILGRHDKNSVGVLFDDAPHFGVGRLVSKLRVGLGYSPKMEGGRHRIAVGIGKDGFRHDIDLAFRYIKPDNGYSMVSDLRLRYRTRRFILIPRVTFGIHDDDEDYKYLNVGLGINRSIYGEGFIYFAGEYEPWFGDIATDHVIFQVGVDLPVSRKLSFLAGLRQSLDYRDVWSASATEFQPGLRLKYDELQFFMTLRKELIAQGLFDSSPIVNFGLEYDFSNL